MGTCQALPIEPDGLVNFPLVVMATVLELDKYVRISYHEIHDLPVPGIDLLGDHIQECGQLIHNLFLQSTAYD